MDDVKPITERRGGCATPRHMRCHPSPGRRSVTPNDATSQAGGKIKNMNEHLKKARRALERQGRSVPGRGPKPEDYAEAVQEILAYLEELDRQFQKPMITVNSK